MIKLKSDTKEICQDILLKILEECVNITNPYEITAESMKKKLEKKVEISNPQIITTPQKESVDDYHENLLRSADNVRPEDIYGYLTQSINQNELKNQIK